MVAIKNTVNNEKELEFIFDYFPEIDKKNNLKKYLQMVNEWGGTHNLNSSKMDENEIINLIKDCVLGMLFLPSFKYVYDAGSGAGFPGIVLAICYPQKKISLVESNRKKCSFLRLVKTQLDLKNVEIVNRRIESLSNIELMVTKAAFSPKNSGVLVGSLAPQGKLAIWATKNTRDSFILKLESMNMRLIKEHEYGLPGVGDRLILLFEKIVPRGTINT